MKRLFIILITTVITLNIWGAKAYPEPVTITQKDGKILTYRLHGDEHFNYVATTDGVLLYQQGMDFYIAVIDDKGNMSSSGVLAHNAGQRTAEEIALIGKQDKDKFFATEKASVARSRSMRRISMPDNIESTFFPHMNYPDGQRPKALVILADFADWKFKRYVESDKENDQITKAIFGQYLNAMDAAPYHPSDPTLSLNLGSVAKYFSDMSKGAFVPQFDVATVVHLPENMSVYGPGKYDDMPKFFEDVCNFANDSIDFSEYDANNDGYVDLVYVIYAGYGQSTGGGTNTIWPKSGTVSITEPYEDENGNPQEREIPYDGKYICRYGVNPELNFDPASTNDYFKGVPQINGIGLFCHEFSHCMGLPDIYPTSESAQNAGNPAMEFWDLMDGGEYGGTVTVTVVVDGVNKKMSKTGGYNPTAYTAWEREYVGWMKMDVLKAENCGQKIDLINIDRSDGKAYKIFPDDNENGEEYVCIQNIQSYKWNKWLGTNIGHGMLVTYVKYDKPYFSLSENDLPYVNKVNNTIGKSRMTIVPADGLLISSYLSGIGKQYTSAEYIASHKGDPFPGTSNVHNLYSIPLIWAGQPMDKPLLNIQENNQIVSFYYMFEPAEKNEDISEVNVHELSMITESDENQIINEHEWKDAEDNTIATGYKVKNFQEVALGIESNIVNASDCNILSLCVKPSQAITLNVTLTSGTPETNSNSKVALGMNSRKTDNGVSTLTKSYELEAGEWRTLGIQLSSFAAQGVDLSEINSVILGLGSEPDNKKDNILFLEDVYFSQSTRRAIATFINQTDTTTAKEKKVYTLDGRYVGNNTRGLAKGVYIINGKKTVIR